MKSLQIKTFGNSMFPFFVDGDVVELERKTFSGIKLNDFITFRRKGKFVTHRVIYKPGNKYLISKGDNNPYHDGRVYPKDVVGKVVGIRRNGREINPESLYLIQSTLYFKEITKVKQALEKAELDFVFLKGLPLHLYYEKTHPKRIYADCDLLINKKDFLRSSKILRKLGYKKIKDPLSLTGDMTHSEVSFYKEVNNFKVIFDLHLEIVFLMTQLRNLDALYPQELLDKLSQDFLNNKRFIKINNETYPILSEDDLVLYLALHLFHHNFNGYYRYELLNKVINSKEVNYQQVGEKILKYKLQNFIYPVFLLLKKYYSPIFPKIFLKEIKPRGKILKEINETVINIDIFEDESRIKAGTQRFKYIYRLSPLTFWRKMFIFTNKQVLYSVFFVIQKKLFTFFLRYNFFIKKRFGKIF